MLSAAEVKGDFVLISEQYRNKDLYPKPRKGLFLDLVFRDMESDNAGLSTRARCPLGSRFEWLGMSRHVRLQRETDARNGGIRFTQCSSAQVAKTFSGEISATVE